MKNLRTANLSLAIGPMLIAVAVLIALAAAGMYALSGVRALVGAESLWSRAQKDAIYHLVRYAHSANASDYQSYQAAIAVPLGDRKAREALDRPAAAVDYEAARRGFLEGRNDSADIDSMSAVFVHLRHLPYIANAIDIWAQGDRLIERMNSNAVELQGAVQGSRDPGRIEAVVAQLQSLNTQLGLLEDEFSYTLGQASRWATRVLIIFLTILGTVMVIAAGLVYGREFSRTLAADAALRESQEVLSLAMRSGRMGAFVCDLATHEVWWSRELEELFGLPVGGFPGTDAAFLQLVHEQDRATVKRVVERAIAAGTDYAIEFRFCRGPDTWRWMDGRGHVVYGADGRPSRLVGIGIDITEHKQAEESARQLEARFHTMADAMPQLAMIARPDGWIEWYNRRWYEYTGTTPAAVAGWGWESLHDASVLPAVLERWRASIASGEPFEMVFPLRRADGVYRTFLTRIMPLKDDAGRVLQWFGTGTDITAQQHAEETLRIADQRKDAFIATLAHELRNPLAPIRHAVEIMRLPGTAAAELVTMRDIIDRQVRHLTRLVDDLLEVSRITRGNVQLRTERVSLAGPLNDAIEAVQPLMKSSGHALTVELPVEPIQLVCDPTRITQVVLNLLNNAAKFTPLGGHIWLSSKLEGNDAVILVGDTGIGIPEANLSRIFEMFSQVSPPIERTHGGLGIGLALARGLVQLHAGDIRASSAGVGRGSEFTVRLPLSSTAEPTAGSPRAGEKVVHCGARRKILVVDDNLDSAHSLSKLLQHMGQEVQEVHDGVDAINAADEFQPDIVLMDIGMPKLNGYDAACEIRLRAGSRAMTIMAVTGWGQDEDKQRSAAAGFDGHFTKPIDAAQLQAMLDRIPPGNQAVTATI
jgi:PAS domain S-box-containing protein